MKAEREYKMSEPAREAVREYARRWREAHPERAKQIQRDYWERRGLREREKRECKKQEGGENEKA